MFDTDTNQPTPSQEPPQGLLSVFAAPSHTPPSHGKHFTAQILNEEDIKDFLKLQKSAWKALPPDEKHFLKIRTRKDLLEHMGHRMPIIGVRDETGKLVGQCLLSYPCRGEAVKNISGYPLNKNTCTTAIVQSLAVDPEMRGQKISEKILEAAKDIAVSSGRIVILAKVAQDNSKSSKSFLNAAFSKTSQGFDPIKGYPVNYWQYSLYQGCSAPPQCVAN